MQTHAAMERLNGGPVSPVGKRLSAAVLLARVTTLRLKTAENEPVKLHPIEKMKELSLRDSLEILKLPSVVLTSSSVSPQRVSIFRLQVLVRHCAGVLGPWPLALCLNAGITLAAEVGVALLATESQ